MNDSASWKAFVRLAPERSHHDRVECGRDIRVPGARCGRLLGELLERDRDCGVAFERHAAGQALVQDHADRVEVRCRSDVEAFGLLRREVVDRAEDRPGFGDLRQPGAGDAEVGDRGQAGRVDDHVHRLEVAVDDTVAVGEAGGLEDLADDRDGLDRGEAEVDQVPQRPAVEVGHRDVVRVVHLAAVVDRDDVYLLECGCGFGLAAETLDELLVAGEVVVEDLERDPPG